MPRNGKPEQRCMGIPDWHGARRLTRESTIGMGIADCRPPNRPCVCGLVRCRMSKIDATCHRTREVCRLAGLLAAAGHGDLAPLSFKR